MAILKPDTAKRGEYYKKNTVYNPRRKNTNDTGRGKIVAKKIAREKESNENRENYEKEKELLTC
ncbi:MAG: hypothetical protein R3Y53_07400 [Bacillota bacterium]